MVMETQPAVGEKLQHRLLVRRRRRPPICEVRDPRENLRRAVALVRGAARFADENRAAARRIAGSGGVVWPTDRGHRDRGQRAAAAHAAAHEALVERFGMLDEGDAEKVRRRGYAPEWR